MPSLAERTKPMIVDPDQQTKNLLPDADQFDIVASIDGKRRVCDVFLVVSASTLTRHYKLICSVAKKFDRHLRVLFIRQDTDTNALLDKLFGTELKKLSKRWYIFEHGEEVDRILNAWLTGDEKNCVASARLDDDNQIIVQDCTLAKHAIAFSKIKALSAIKAEDRTKIEVQKYGHYVCWPDYDIELDILDVIRSFDDPKYVQKKQVASLTQFVEYGDAIRELRKERGFTQDTLAEAADLDKKTVGRIERGEQSPTYQALEKLAKAQSMKPDEYMHSIARKVQELRAMQRSS